MYLSDCFIPLIACVAYALPEAEKKETPYSDFRSSVIAHVDRCRLHPDREGVEEDDYTQAMFAVFCWVDDRVMQSAWSGKSQWQKESLQRVYLKTAQGGAEFFTRLKETDSSQRGVLEVFYLCLLAGFRGRYGSEDDEQILDNLKSGVRKKMLRDDETLVGEGQGKLFPAPYEGVSASLGGPVIPPEMPMLRLLFLFSPVCFCGILFVIYRFILNSEMITSLVP
ncbi:DotU family type IV/VI secretion system protein [Desulfoluna sp.]|uniref:DotU family type IV/VI secretion system protein n=1 Tax=Desulfoluna sp. TaxID=2045199 RepID=UPI00260E1988|nr:DotU family type IV/VI secretion system protein [Desulfoluna sp.]